MRKKSFLLVLTLVLVLIATVGLVGCDNKDEAPVTLSSVKVVGPTEYYFEDFSFSKLNLELRYSDGSRKSANVSENMISEKDREAVKFLDADSEGKAVKKIAVSYLGKQANFTFTMLHNPELKDLTGLTFEQEQDYTFDPAPNAKPVSLEVKGLENLPSDVTPTVVYRNNSQINAGEHKVTAQISAPGYKTTEITTTLVIKKLPLFKPQPIYPLIYNTEKQTPIAENRLYKLTGDVFKKDACRDDKSYKITVTLADPTNYEWVGTDEISFDIDWKIFPKVVDLSNIKWDYNQEGFLYKKGITYGVQVDRTSYKEHIKYVKAMYTNSKEDDAVKYYNRRSEAGEYTAEVNFISTDPNYVIDEDSYASKKYLDWKIIRNRLDPSQNVRFETNQDGKMVYVYDGLVHRPNLLNLDTILQGETSDLKVSYSTEGYVDVNEGGDYYIKAVITKPGYETLEVEGKFAITPKFVDVPVISKDSQSFVYDGLEHRVQIISEDANSYVVQGNLSATEPNIHWLTFKLASTKNYRWNNGTTEGDIKEKTDYWQITKVALPTEEFTWSTNNTFEYNKKFHEVNVVTNNMEAISVSYLDEKGNITNIKKDAGNYTAVAHVSLRYIEDSKLYDNSGNIRQDAVEIIETIYGNGVYELIDKIKKFNASNNTLQWQINPKEIDFSAVAWNKREFVYLETLEDTLYKVMLVNVPKEVEDEITYSDNEVLCKVGEPFVQSHIATFTVSKNYVLLNQNVVREHNWEIRPNLLLGIDFANTDREYNENGNELVVPNGNFNEITKDANVEIFIKTPYDDEFRLAVKDEMLFDAGKYEQKLVITKPGYTCYSKVITYTINPKQIKVPTLKKDRFVFNGEIQDCGLLAKNAGYDIEGKTSAVMPNADGYTLTISLKQAVNKQGEPIFDKNNKPVYNYIWDNGSTNSISLTWYIDKLHIDVDSIVWDGTNQFVYNGESQSVKLTQLPLGIKAVYETKANQMVVDSAINKGEYVTSVKLSTIFDESEQDLITRCYENPEVLKAFNNDVSKSRFVWNITPKIIDFAGIYWDNTTFIYLENPNDKYYQVKLVNLPKDLENIIEYQNNIVYVTGDSKDVVGNYIATFTISDNYELKNDQGKKEHTWKVVENKLVGITFEDKEVIYAEGGYGLIIATASSETLFADAKIEYYVNGKPVEISYTYIYTGNFEEKVVISKPGYTCYTKTVHYNIKPQKISVPKLAKEHLPFNGEIQSCGIKENEKYLVKGNNSAIMPNADGYTLTIELKQAKDHQGASVFDKNGDPVYNYIWDTSSPSADISNKQVTWYIDKLVFDKNALNWNSVGDIVYNGVAQQVMLENLPKGIMAEYTTKLNGHAIGKPINQGTYQTQVKLYTVFDESDIESINACYQNPEAITQYNNDTSINRITWTILPKHIDVQAVKWSANNDERPLIYEEDWMGKPKQHEVKLINIPNEIAHMFTFEGNVGSIANVPYLAKANFFNEDGNYILDNKTFSFEYAWEIKVNNLDWFIFDKVQQPLFAMEFNETGKPVVLDQEPSYTLNLEEPRKTEVLKDIKDEIIKIEYITREGFTTTKVANVGTYKYIVRVTVPGYAVKEQLVEFSIKPLPIKRPEIDVDKSPLNSYNYDGKEHAIPIKHNIPKNYGDYRWYYRMDETNMTSVGSYSVRAELISSNFIWEATTVLPATPNAYELGFEWQIVDPTASVSYRMAKPSKAEIKQNNN